MGSNNTNFRLHFYWHDPLVTSHCLVLCACVCMSVTSVVSDSVRPDPMDCSPPGSSVRGNFQARILEWVAVPSSKGSSPPRDQTHASCMGRQILASEPPGKPQTIYYFSSKAESELKGLTVCAVCGDRACYSGVKNCTKNKDTNVENKKTL